jgi:hypothetical protein
MRTFLVALALGVSLAAWPRPSLGQAARTVPTVEVQNNFDQPIVVFLEHGRFDRRLGTVEAGSTAALPLPEWLARGSDRIQLFVVRSGGQRIESQWFEVRPGGAIGMIVPSAPAASAQIYMELSPEELFKTTLTVFNERATEVDVYAQEGPFEVRLGSVPAYGTATLEFPASVVRPDRSITVVARPKTGFDLESYPLQLRAESHLALRLRPVSTWP